MNLRIYILFDNKRMQHIYCKIIKFQDGEWKTFASMYLLNMSQGVIMNGGLLIGSLYCAYLVSAGNKTVGDYALFGSYIAQVMVPLNWLGTLYRYLI